MVRVPVVWPLDILVGCGGGLIRRTDGLLGRHDPEGSFTVRLIGDIQYTRIEESAVSLDGQHIPETPGNRDRITV